MLTIIYYFAAVISSLIFILLIGTVVILKLITKPYPEILRYEEEKSYLDVTSKERRKFPLLQENASINLSVVVPAYNEEDRLCPMMDEAIQYLEKRLSPKFTYEIIVVSDGSRDHTVDVAHSYTKKWGVDKVRCLELIKNRGKGGAVRLVLCPTFSAEQAGCYSNENDPVKCEESQGDLANKLILILIATVLFTYKAAVKVRVNLLARSCEKDYKSVTNSFVEMFLPAFLMSTAAYMSTAIYNPANGVQSSRGACILFADADGATKFEDLSKLEDALKEITSLNLSSGIQELSQANAIVIGSRAHLEKESLATRSIFRNILMYGFHFMVWLFAVRGIKDTQCGFKLFTKTAAQTCFESLHVDRWAFDVELLRIAQKLKIPISEVGVRWMEIEGSKVTPVITWIQMGVDLCLIWLKYSIGAWRIKSEKLK